MPKLSQLKATQKILYKSIVSVYCPILTATVFFTSEGFNHLLYTSNRKPRKVSEQYMKLQCLAHAQYVMEKSTRISETRKTRKKIKGKFKNVISYALVCEVSKNKQIRVIVEKVGTGKHKFLSIMPHNNRSKH